MAHTLTLRQHVKIIAVLCKWRVVILMLITAAVGMALAPLEQFSLYNTVGGLAGIGLLACSGGAINQILESDIDTKMTRTHHRPLVQTTLSTKNAILIAIINMAFGSLILMITTNTLCVVLTIATMTGYGFVYTKLLKPYTSQNIVIGGIFGAMPPLLGWCAITDQVDPFPLLLVAIIYTWTPSHFWSLSLAKIDDYKHSPLPMLPITHGVTCTQIQIILYTFLLILITQLPYLLTYTSIYYFILVNLANLWLFSAMLDVYRKHDYTICMRAFKRSNIYLLLVFLSLLIGKWT